MKTPKVDYTGQRINYLTVVRFIPANEREGYSINKDTRRWLCKCDCGKYVRVRSDQLKDRRINSCGCMAGKLSGDKHKKHGMKNTRLYRIWHGMKCRCNNQSSKDFGRYGGRGVSVCSEWANDFSCFYNWAIANGYNETLSLDRKDNEKGYCPENCRWINNKWQCRNRRDNVYVTYKGDSKTIAELCDLLNFDRALAYHRHSRGWTGEEIFEKPKRICKRKE